MPVQFSDAVTAVRYYRAIFRKFRDVPEAGVWAWFVSDDGPLGRKAARHSIILPHPGEVSSAGAAIAHLNRWRWMVACPDCAVDFQLAFESPAVFMCSACWNAQAGYTWRRVVFPSERDRLESILGSPAIPPPDRNWLPGWTVERATIEAGNRSPISIDGYREALKVTA